MDPILQNVLIYVPGTSSPIVQSIILTIAIIAVVCYIDRNVLHFLYLVFISLPALGFMRVVMWVRLYPRLQWDRLQLFLRLRRKHPVTGGAQVSKRHLKMAKQLLDELQNGNQSRPEPGADDYLQ